jgi:hypothetical protein
VSNKAQRVYHFHNETLKALKEIVEAAGLQHPREINTSHIVRRVNANEVHLLAALLPQLKPGSLLNPVQGSGLPSVYDLYWQVAQAESFSARIPETATTV